MKQIKILKEEERPYYSPFREPRVEVPSEMDQIYNKKSRTKHISASIFDRSFSDFENATEKEKKRIQLDALDRKIAKKNHYAM